MPPDKKKRSKSNVYSAFVRKLTVLRYHLKQYGSLSHLRRVNTATTIQEQTFSSLGIFLSRLRSNVRSGDLCKEKIEIITERFEDLLLWIVDVPIRKEEKSISVARRSILETSSFVDHHGRLYITEKIPIRQAVYDAMGCQDIPLQDCKRFDNNSMGTIERVLSFIIFPEIPPPRILQPSPVNHSSGDSSGGVIVQSTYYENVLPALLHSGFELSSFDNIIPPWVVASIRVCTSKDDCVAMFEHVPGLDHFFYGSKGKVCSTLSPIVGSMLPQPRRSTQSVSIGTDREMNQTRVRDLFIYGAAGRPPFDWRAKTISPTLCSLGEMLWRLLWHDLTPASQVCPPTGCQMLYMASLFGSKVQPHRDNGSRDSTMAQVGTSTDKSLNSHMIGTSVIVLSRYDTMDFFLSKDKKGIFNRDKSERVCFPLGDWSVFVLHPHDDEQLYHASRFPWNTTSSKLRVAMVFRWVTKRCTFYCGNDDGPRTEAYVSEQADIAEILNRLNTGKEWANKLGYNMDGSVT